MATKRKKNVAADIREAVDAAKAAKKKKKAAKKPARVVKRKALMGDLALASLGSADRSIGRAPGRRDVSLQVRMPGAMRAALVNHARAAGTTAGAVIRDACAAWLASRGVKLAAADVGDPRQLALGVA